MGTKTKRKLGMSGLIALVLVGLLATCALAAPKVFVNGSQIKFDVEPVIDDGRILVPLRAIFQALNANVEWDGGTKTIVATSRHGEVLTLQVGNTQARLEKNGTYRDITLDVPPKIIDNRTLVPIRIVGESFNKDVKWEAKALSAYIDDAKNYDHYVGEAEYYFAQKDYGRAVFWYDKALQESPNSADLYYKKADCNVELSDLNSALFNLNKALTIDASQSEYYSLRATVHDRMGKTKEAAADRQRAAELGN